MNRIALTMRWEQYLSVNDRYERGTRPKLRPKCGAWMEELAWRVKLLKAGTSGDWPEDATYIVDVEMRFPEDCRDRDADNYFKSILDGLEMGLGISDSRMIPYIRSIAVVPEGEAGFTIAVYPSEIAGHGLIGTVMRLRGGSDCIVLEEPVPTVWHNQRVVVNMGMMIQEACHG